MRKLLRMLAGVMIIGAIAIVVPPATANHYTTDPIPGQPHQHPPSPAVSEPDVVCVVTGEVAPGTDGGTAHQLLNMGPDIPGSRASHSHYNFIQTLIACNDFPTGTGVTANGGNDGHIVDPEDPVGSLWHHAGNDHHGSTNESGWSHCSDYSGDADNSCNDANVNFVTDTESNVCGASDDKGKGDIELPTDGDGNFGDTGWVKYLRVGVVIYAWGCFDTPQEQIISNNPHFSAVLAIFPPAVLTGGVVGNPDFPLCLVPAPPGPGGSCGFTLVGVAWRGNAWLVDTAVPGGITDYLHCVDQNLPIGWLPVPPTTVPPTGGCQPFPPNLR